MIVDASNVRSILVIKLRAIGDVLLSTAVLPNIRAFFPAAQIDFLTERVCRPVVEGNPYINSVLEFDPARQSGLSLIASVRRRSYDLVFDLFGNPRSALVTLLSGAPNRVGFRFSWRRRCYNSVVNGRGGEVHNVEFNLDALRAMNIPIVSTKIHFPISSAANEFALRTMDALGLRRPLVVALNPGGGWYTKRWPAERYAQIGSRIAEEFGARVLVVWGPGEEEGARSIVAATGSAATLAPKTTLEELAAILGHCTVLVTNDSGPMHIAAALGTPVIAIFGPTRPELQGPVGSHHEIVRNEHILCLGCNYTECPIGNPCMNDLAVETVLDRFRMFIRRCAPIPETMTS